MIHKKIDIVVQNNTANLYTYILDNTPEIDKDRIRPIVIICPGGGYRTTSDRESEPVALQFNSMGYHACVLRYSIKPIEYPVALLQLARTISYIRENSKEWNIDRNKIIVCGFSAGGHLAANMGTMWNEPFISETIGVSQEQIKPNGMILSYPVISSGEFAHKESIVNLLGSQYDDIAEKVSLEKCVDMNTVPAFIWHTVSDNIVPVENSLLLAEAMQKNNISFELHIYPKGRHGLSLATEETGNFAIQEECQNWITMAGRWIKNLS